MNNNKKSRLLHGPLLYLMLLAAILAVVWMLDSDSPATYQDLSYSELLDWVETDLRADNGETLSKEDAGKTIESIVIQENVLYGLCENSSIPDANFPQSYDFKAVIPNTNQFYNDVNNIYESVLGHTVRPTEYTFTFATELPPQASWLAEWLPLIVTMILFALLWFFLMRQQAGGGKGGVMGFGKSRARQMDPKANKVTFKDVAGADEEKEELREIVQFLKDPRRFTKVGAKIPTGILLVGPPGTGKTLLARAVAGEAGVPFFTISGSDFVEMFVGVGASRVRDLFSEAKKNAPAIIFIDEIDAVGRQRGAGLGGGHDEREQTLNQLLVEMDGFTHNEGVIVMAATNRSDVLDPALLRPGRFDRRIIVNYPDVIGREAILKVHSHNKPLAKDVDLSVLARRTPYFTGADLMNVMNEAALLTARRKQNEITMAAIEEAITRVVAGPEKRSKRITEMDRRLVAFHEGGHAIVSYYIPECDKVHEITTIPRGQAGGYTMYLPQEEFNYITTARLNAQMASLMGGRVAEAIVFGDISTGASSDIKRATEIARGMVTEYGMSSKLGPVFLGTEHEVFLGKQFSQQNSGFSEQVNEMIDSEVRSLLTQAYARAERILTEHRDQLDALAALLIEREKIDYEEFECFMQGKELPAPKASDYSVKIDAEPEAKPETDAETKPEVEIDPETDAQNDADGAAPEAKSEPESAQDIETTADDRENDEL
ncbi:MAG: ATP-dependent zinc metalloprotease FtsH [Clostridia bacterium]|nr:ATP-dependent zinc metalloprotease FtsH [Clostridia bacterium]